MTLLQTQNLSAFYGDFQALFGINVTVEQGETVADYWRQRRRQNHLSPHRRRRFGDRARHRAVRRPADWTQNSA